MIKIDLLKNHPNAIPALAQILKEELYNDFPEYDTQEINQWFYEWMNDDLPLAYIALLNDIPLGCCSLQLDDGLRPDLSPWFGDLAVKKNTKNKGSVKCWLTSRSSKQKNLALKNSTCLLLTPPCQSITNVLGGRKSVWMNLNLIL
jgi:hypothetical protein